MFDLKTIVIVLLFNALLQSVVWTLIWLSWRRFYELKFVAGGVMLIAAGLFLFMDRSGTLAAWRIIVQNLLIKGGLLLLADGLARFLRQPRYPRLAVALFGFHAVTWSAATIFYPGDLTPRVLSAAVFITVVMLFMCLTLWRDRTQPRALRWITIAVLLEYVMAFIAEFIFMVLPRPINEGRIMVLSNDDGWFFLQANLFLMAYFGCMLAMVSNRLASDLRRRNEALAREVERRRELETELSASLDAEKKLREDQEQFIRMVGHEFRTPLAIIKRATEMVGLILSQPPPELSRRFASINEAVDRMITLTDRFLVADRRDGILQIETLDIGDLLDDVERHFDAMGGADRLRIVRSEDTLLYRGDPDMLLTVLINLVDNALKYSPPDSAVEIAVEIAGEIAGEVTVQDSATSEPSARAILITVSDTGIGIPAKEQGRVGSRFYRASNTRAGTGTGLGLYNSRRLLAYHGANLTLADRCSGGRGTVAMVRLPLPGPEVGVSQHPLEKGRA